MNYDARLQKLEVRRVPKPRGYTTAMYEYGDDRRLAGVKIAGQRVDRLPGESKEQLSIRATQGHDPDWIMWIDFVDARNGKPYPWAD